MWYVDKRVYRHTKWSAKNSLSCSSKKWILKIKKLGNTLVHFLGKIFIVCYLYINFTSFAFNKFGPVIAVCYYNSKNHDNNAFAQFNQENFYFYSNKQKHSEFISMYMFMDVCAFYKCVYSVPNMHINKACK